MKAAPSPTPNPIAAFAELLKPAAGDGELVAFANVSGAFNEIVRVGDGDEETAVSVIVLVADGYGGAVETVMSE